MSKPVRFILRMFGYRTVTITLARNIGFGEVGTVVYKPANRKVKV